MNMNISLFIQLNSDDHLFLCQHYKQNRGFMSKTLYRAVIFVSRTISYHKD